MYLILAFNFSFLDKPEIQMHSWIDLVFYTTPIGNGVLWFLIALVYVLSNSDFFSVLSLL